jgi:uncharacterized protein (DUF433 family)
MDSPLIYDRGRGPELRRIRITVYDLIPYLESGSITDAEILDVLPITAEELAALKQYIADHHAEVMAVHHQIEERIRKGIEAQNNSPQMRAWVRETEGRVQYYPTWLKQREQEAANGGAPLPATGPERLKEYLAWWRAHRHEALSGAAR